MIEDQFDNVQEEADEIADEEVANVLNEILQAKLDKMNAPSRTIEPAETKVESDDLESLQKRMADLG